MRRWLAILVVVLALAGLIVAQKGRSPNFSPAERATIAGLSLAALPPLPADPSDRHADDPAAAAFGATLFFDVRLSGAGNVSCSTCHKLDRQFQDDRPRARGVADTVRRTMPLAGAAYNTWFFWDGRRDSLWAQALTPLEDAREQAGDRLAYARFVAAEYDERYGRIFGALPDLSGLPAHASPLGDAAQRAAWMAMTDAQREGIDRVFANIGKAIEAFERSIMPAETRFDRFAAALARGERPQGDAALTELEVEGLRLFIGPANCSTCHNGPRFTDGQFHNTGIAPVATLAPDTGRAAGAPEALADPFNCLGRFSDAGPKDCGALRFIVAGGDGLRRAYKTPSLRGVAGRPPYMHAGQVASLDEAVAHYASADGKGENGSELHRIVLTDRGRQALVAFLRTLGQ